MSEIQLKLIDLLHKNLRLKMPISEIHADTSIFGKSGLGLDSVDALEIAVLLDKHFSVRLDEQDPTSRAALTTIGSLADYIHTKTRVA
jgi:acyl carrier protein